MSVQLFTGKHLKNKLEVAEEKKSELGALWRCWCSSTTEKRKIRVTVCTHLLASLLWNCQANLALFLSVAFLKGRVRYTLFLVGIQVIVSVLTGVSPS